jgi:iron complex transport system ATP-binding protein
MTRVVSSSRRVDAVLYPRMQEALNLEDVSVELESAARPLLRAIDWRVLPGEHWAVIGANGAGKTTLLRLLTGVLEPTSGRVTVFGGSLGIGGLSDPRLRVGTIEGQPRTFAQRMTALEVVTLQNTGPAAMIGARVTDAHLAQGRELLALFGCGHLETRHYAGCSQGERQRILLARVLMREPDLLLFDEPITGLDLPSREGLLQAMTRLAVKRPELATVTVTHHLEELPPTTTHALLLREGEEIAAGPVQDTITQPLISECFGIPIQLDHVDGRWAVRAHAPNW